MKQIFLKINCRALSDDMKNVWLMILCFSVCMVDFGLVLQFSALCSLRCELTMLYLLLIIGNHINLVMKCYGALED